MGISISQSEYNALVQRGLLQPHHNMGQRTGVNGRILLTIFGEPIAKPRMTQRDKWAKRPCVLRYGEWCDRARAVAGIMPPSDQIAEIEIWTFFEPPVSWSKKRRLESIGLKHRTKPDFDNLAKAVVDALWKEDSGIADAVVRKRWSWSARVEIAITLEKT